MKPFRAEVTIQKGGKEITKNEPMEKVKNMLTVCYDEDSVLARRSRLPSNSASLHLVEHVIFFSAAGLDTGGRKRKHFKGSTLGDFVGPVALPGVEETWQETFKSKKALLGAARIPVGGATFKDPDAHPGDQDVKKQINGWKRNDHDLEPVFYHGHGPKLWEEILHNICKTEKIHGIVDLTAGDGELAMVAIRLRLPYLGFTLSDIHNDKLTRSLRSRVWKEFQREGSELYEVGLVEILGNIDAADDDKDDNDDDNDDIKDNGKKTGKGRGRGRGRGKSNPVADPTETKNLAKSFAAKKRKAAADEELEDGELEDKEEAEDSGIENLEADGEDQD